MPAIRCYSRIQGWEPAPDSDDTDSGLTLEDLPPGFHVDGRHYHGHEMTMRTTDPRRLAPFSDIPYSANNAYPHATYDLRPRLERFRRYEQDPYVPSGSNQHFATAPAAGASQSFTPLPAPPIPVFALPTPPHTRSPSLASASTSSSVRSMTSSRSAAAAGVVRKHKSSTERKIERKRAENANYIPRPKNSFILFRTDFVTRHKRAAEAVGSTARAAAAATTAAILAERGILGDIVKMEEGDGDDDTGASLSKQASEVWNRMSEEEKQPWVELAEKEKAEHARKYPDYRYRPTRQNSQSSGTLPTASNASMKTRKSASPDSNAASQSFPRPISPAPSSTSSTAGTDFVEGIRARAQAEEFEREKRAEEQRRRCELISGLMREGYRGGELTTALLMLEGGALPPQNLSMDDIPTDPALENLAPSVPAQFTSQISSQLQRRFTPPTLSLQNSNISFMPLASGRTSSSSSLARALIPTTPSPPTLPTVPAIPTIPTVPNLVAPIPRSPSAPVFDTRTFASGISPETRVKNVSPTSASCPSTPHPHSMDSSRADTLSMDTDDEESSSPTSNASSLPTHSIPSSPDVSGTEKSSTKPAGPVPILLTTGRWTSNMPGSTPGFPVNAHANEQSDFMPMNEYYEHYDSHVQFTPTALPTVLEQVEACQVPPTRGFEDTPQPLEAVAALWTQARQMSPEVSPTSTTGPATSVPESATATDSCFFPRIGTDASSSVAAQLQTWPEDVAPDESDDVTPTSAAFSAISIRTPADGLANANSNSQSYTSARMDVSEEQMRHLTGLPSPPAESRALTRTSSTPASLSSEPAAPIEQSALHPASSLGSSANHSTDVGLEAYQLGLGNALGPSDAAYVDTFSDGDGAGFDYFNLDYDMTLPESTLSYSALGLSFSSGTTAGTDIVDFADFDFALYERDRDLEAQAKSDYDDYVRYIRSP